MKCAGVVLAGCVLALAGAALASCATWKPAKLPGGQAGYTIDCSGPSLSWAHCFQRAGRACPHGYTIAKRSERGGSRIVSGDLFDLVGDKVQHRRMLIGCKDGAVAAGVSAAGAQTVTLPSAPPASNANEDDDSD
ncbi:MAG TPA: hypothetical protein VFS86_06215 [Rhodanobacteraceae bacterium]|nr:hypothetical protein [Rhodanobacteraceae bacterium]